MRPLYLAFTAFAAVSLLFCLAALASGLWVLYEVVHARGTGTVVVVAFDPVHHAAATLAYAVLPLVWIVLWLRERRAAQVERLVRLPLVVAVDLNRDRLRGLAGSERDRAALGRVVTAVARRFVVV
jgi:hypothetical protein